MTERSRRTTERDVQRPERARAAATTLRTHPTIAGWYDPDGTAWETGTGSGFEALRGTVRIDRPAGERGDATG